MQLVMAVVVISLLLAAGLWIRRDYQGWRALGIGGLPHTPKGWLTMSYFRLRKREARGVGLYAGAIGRPDDHSFLGELPRRSGERPTIAPWPIPHRQLDQFTDPLSRQALEEVFAAAVAREAQTVHFKLSFFEKHSPAVTLLQPGTGHAHARCSEGEVAHIHPRDGSMHMIFSPSDAKKVIEAGWGERHPSVGVLPRLPDTYLYIYPPRDPDEVKVVGQLLQASIDHMSGSRREAARAVS